MRKKAGGLATRRLGCKISTSGLDQRPLRGRDLRPAAIGTVRLRRLALARHRQLLGLWRDRAFDELEADLFRRRLSTRLVLDQDDADVAAALELAEQHLVRQWLLDVL